MKFIYWLLATILLASCSVNNKSENTSLNEQNTIEIEKQEEISQEDKNMIFENNLKCSWYRDSIDEYVNKYLNISSLDESNIKWESIIFYSPKYNSCLFSIWTVLEIDDDMTYSFRLFEYWTYNEMLIKNYVCALNSEWSLEEQAEYFRCAKEKNDEMIKFIEQYRK